MTDLVTTLQIGKLDVRRLTWRTLIATVIAGTAWWGYVRWSAAGGEPLLRVGAAVIGSVALLTAAWSGTTLVSLLLHGPARKWFQYAVALIYPLAASTYFLGSANTLDLAWSVGELITAGSALAITAAVAVGWFAAPELHQEHPFRGFLIWAALVFLFNFTGFHGTFFDDEMFGEVQSMFVDKEYSRLAAGKGFYAIAFLVYTLAGYTGLAIRHARLIRP